MDEQDGFNDSVSPEPDEQNKSDLKKVLAGGESERANDFVSIGRLTKRQNIFLASVGVVVVIAISLAVWQMGRILKLPLPTTGKEKAIVAQEAKALDLSEKNPAELKKADTDADKINDFEELYVYETSPYLADSDSDGIDDFDEIANHTDPTCAEGKNCFSAGAATSASEPANGAAAIVGVAEVSAADLRQLLVQAGQVTAEQAAAIDDKTLLDIYGQALEQNPDLAKSLQPGATANNDAGDPSAKIADNATDTAGALKSLGGLNAADVRKMLLEQGFSEKELNEIDDKTLMALYQEALGKAGESVE